MAGIWASMSSSSSSSSSVSSTKPHRRRSQSWPTPQEPWSCKISSQRWTWGHSGFSGTASTAQKLKLPLLLVALTASLRAPLCLAQERSLASITTQLVQNQTVLRIVPASVDPPIECDPQAVPPCDTVDNVYAGLTLAEIEVVVVPDTFSADLARLRIVRENVTREAARNGACAQGEYETSMHAPANLNAPWGELGVSTSVEGGILKADAALTFFTGGVFRICYSQDGTFGFDTSDLVPTLLSVNGVYDNSEDCKRGVSCLFDTRYYCYVLKNSYNNFDNSSSASTSCVVNYNTAYTGVVGPVSTYAGTWSSAWSATYSTDAGNDGQLLTVAPQACQTEPAGFLCYTGGSCDVGGPYIPPNEPDQKGFSLPAARSDLDTDVSTFKPYTVAACYCPNYGGCDSFGEFLQKVGVLHFFATKTCRHGFNAQECLLDFGGASPQYRFAVRVECPTDACLYTNDNRMKIVTGSTNNDIPSWDASTGCNTAVHGFSALRNRMVLLPEDANIPVEDMSGGLSQRMKLWNFHPDDPQPDGSYRPELAGFQFNTGFTSHELRNAYEQETYDVCFCNADCNTGQNWFKAGQIRFASFRLVSARSQSLQTGVDVSNDLSLGYVNQPGVLAFSRPQEDYYVMGLRENGIIKLVQDDMLHMNDTACGTSAYDPLYVDSSGLQEFTASTLYKGTQSDDGLKLVFNSGSSSNTIKVLRAGTMAVCYCAFLDPQTQLCEADQWIFVSHMIIRGPRNDHQWTFSTNVVFRFEFEGFGFSPDDKVRIIDSNSECTDNPDGSYALTNIKLACPDPCTEVGDVDASINGDISVSVLADDAYQCDKQNSGCRSNDIKDIRVVDAHTTVVELENPLLMEEGDLVTLGSDDGNGHIICDTSTGAPPCSAEQLAVLLGRYRFADADDNVAAAPDEYLAGHAVHLDPQDSRRFFMPVGWPAPAPRFLVQYLNNKRGKWRRHNKATTKEEIMGTRQRADMKVCWKYGQESSVGKYIAQVGTLSLQDPNPMAECQLSLMTSVRGQHAPLVVSFRTASAQTGLRYSQVQGPTQLKIRFHDRHMLGVYFTDDTTINPNEAEDEMHEARQYVCGKLFREVWSSDQELGFPMPHGCFYRVYGQTVELSMLFSEKSGLRAGMNYQVVVMGVATEEAEIGNDVVHVFTMDDANLRPYEAIERGEGHLQSTPKAAAYGSTGVMFDPEEGFKVIGGESAEMLELTGGQALQFELKGDPAGGGITGGSILRIFLWPLFMWDIAALCLPDCIPHDPVSHPCGIIPECKGESVVANYQRNIIKLTLPSGMDDITDEIVHTISIRSLTLPTSGFFATTLAAEISTGPDDLRPMYTTSAGDYLWKVPDEGVMVAKLVSTFGDGNHRPFRGDNDNVLYVNLVMAATLYSFIQFGDASMTLTLPPGYSCGGTAQLSDIDGVSAWAAPSTLSIFGNTIPQGRGSMDEGSGTRGWSVNENTCTYTLRQNGVVFAGSSLYVRVTVNNPDVAMPRSDPTNRWSLTLRSKGYHQWLREFPELAFKAGGQEAKYAENVAVLGIITEAFVVPSNFAMSTGQFGQQQTVVHVWFRTQQTASNMQLRAPPGFRFDPCVIQNLQAEYYATHHGGRTTMRLPGVLSCTWYLTPVNHVLVGLQDTLLLDTHYGFAVTAENPPVYDSMSQGDWAVVTLSSESHEIDGTQTPMSIASVNVSDSTVPMDPGTIDRGWGVYRSGLDTPNMQRVAIFTRMDEMLPFSMTGASTVLYVNPLMPPESGNMKLRIIAPEGFVFDGTDLDFKSAALPQPMQGDNVLLWDEDVNFDAMTNYSFEARVHVPDMSPTTSPNVFLVEFGFDASAIEGRAAAGIIPARPVRALLNAAVDSTTSMQSRDNTVTFDVQTITAIPINGGLLILGPVGFVPLTPQCTVLPPQPKRGSPYNVVGSTSSRMPPTDAGCRARTTADNRIELHITAGPGGIPPAYYRFSVVLTNPRDASTNGMSSTTPCRYTHCWDFSSIQDLEEPAELRVHLDAPLSTPSFNINSRMNVALVAPLTNEQLLLTGRDNRPLHMNPLVLAFNLQVGQAEADNLIIRAPAAFIFRENCLADVEVRGSHVFGFGQALPAGYTAWNEDVKVTSCRGEGPNAVLHLDPGLSFGLQPETLYPFRIAVLSNPATQPEPNLWTIDYAGQSSLPFEGFELWTFTRTSIHPVSTAVTASAAGVTQVIVPVTITFRPYNSVGGAGMKIKLTAPVNFRIYHRESDCNTVEYPILLQPLNTDPSGTSRDPAPPPTYTDPPGIRWGQADFSCVVDAETERIMTATLLADYRTLQSGQDYQMTIMVYNPRGFTPGEVGSWLLETEASPADFLPSFRDKSTIRGYPLNSNFNLWFYQNQDPVTQTVNNNGQAAVDGLYFEFRLPNKLENNDIVTISGPAGFMLQQPGTTETTCNNFRWDPPGVDQLPNSEITCSGMYLHIKYIGANPFGDNRLLAFRVDTTNPRKTPHVMLNYWNAIHQTESGAVRSSDALLGWSINPLLEDVQIKLIGALKAESSVSTMEISFIPIQDADELELIAEVPLGFHFGGSRMDTVGHEVIATSVETVRIRVSLTADVRETLRISNFRLGEVGGPTRFDLQTKLANGVLMDEKFDFVDGFILPGRLTVNDQTKRLVSSYNQDPVTNPVTSLWSPRVNEPAFAEFQFTLTRQAGESSQLRLESTFTLLSSNFMVLDVSSGGEAVIPTTILESGGQTLVARLGLPLAAAPATYLVRVDVVTPFETPPSLWLLDVLLFDDPLTNPLVLPINTNDKLTTGFELVKHVTLQVSSARTPPVAEVELGVMLDASDIDADEFIIVAPLGFNFTAECLILGGPNNEITSCTRYDNIANQSAARLRAAAPLTAPIDGQLLIRATTPAVTTDDPLLRRWYVLARDYASGQQRGWGTDPGGIQVIQMQAATVNYPGIPDVSGEMVFSFITNLKVEEGGALVVGYPQGYTVQCDGEFFHPIAIEGDATCSNDPTQQQFVINMPRPLPPGQLAFSVTATPPSENVGNTFFIMVMDAPPPAGRVVDAAMRISGQDIQHGLEVMSLPLTWTLAEAGRNSGISMGFELLADLPPVNPPTMSQILIEGPSDFFHQVRKPQSVELTGDSQTLPVSETVFNFSLTSLRLRLDESLTRSLARGRYRITFPVLIPSRIPKKNFWTMTICTGSETCSSPFGSNVLVSWPVAGFNLGDVHPSTQFLAVAAAQGLAVVWLLQSMLASCCLLLVSSFAFEWW